MPFLRFDFADAAGVRTTKVFQRPVRIEAAYTVRDVARAIDAVDRATREGLTAAGFVAYEAAPAFDDALTAAAPVPGLPLVWFGLFDSVEGTSVGQAPEAFPQVSTFAPDVDLATYSACIAAIRETIANGDSYQVNYTYRLLGDLGPGDLAALYQHLVDGHAPPYTAYLDLDDWRVISLSPELFFRIQGDRIVSRPMKGTAARGLWPDDDRRRGEALGASAKDRSENVMIADLVRNDISRIAVVGSVAADSLFTIERYPSVWQMTSTVSGRLAPGTSIGDVFRALFPAGSITGAPKTSAMRTIRDLESSPRGVYTGTVGYIEPGGRAVFNVAIRTIVADRDGRAVVGVGGGITWDSVAHEEYEETLNKAAFIHASPPVDLFETMRLDNGRVIRRERHLARLRDSADYFGFSWPAEHIEDRLDAAGQRSPDGSHRLRLTLARTGAVVVEVFPLPAPPTEPVRTALAPHPVPTWNRWLYHKTTARSVYDEARASHPDAFDVLLWNQRGELTEFTIGNVVVQIGGRRLTPPRTAGLLAGTFRGELIDTGAIEEATVSLHQLGLVERMWLVNSLREWIEAMPPQRPVSAMGTASPKI